MTHLDIQVDLAQKQLHFHVAVHQASSDFVLEALKVLEILDFSVVDSVGKPLEFTLHDQYLSVNVPDFHVSYTIKPNHSDCVGCDRDVEVTYPFINDREIFFGSGVFLHPKNLRQIADQLTTTFQLTGIPDGWASFTNLISPQVNPAALSSFFVYSSAQQKPITYTYHDDLVVRFLVQHGKTIPIALTELWKFVSAYLEWLETSLALYDGLREINILFLQAVDNFQSLTNNRAFATGENVLNGIITYGPQNPAYWQRLFGYADYGFYLYDGLAHELMHFYTTTVWQGKAKSVLYPTETCPPADARLIGEALNLYFSRQWVCNYLFGSTEQFFTQALEMHQKHPRKNPLFDLILFDAHLREKNCSLLALYREMIKRKQFEKMPYSSAAFIFEILEEQLGIQVEPYYWELLLDRAMPDYAELIPAAMKQIKWL